MIPIKPLESGSRRSSILKPPKQRQPFQAIVNPILPAVTPTNNVKRRVSFAEKKHVKQFCDSFEEGTVWDNTYEESDSSNHKNVRSFGLHQGSTAHNAFQEFSAISLDKKNQAVDFCGFKERHCAVNVYSEVTSKNSLDNDSQNKIEIINSFCAIESNANVSNILMNTNAMQNSEKVSFSNRNVTLASSSQDDFQETIYNNETITFTKVLPSVPQNDKENIFVHPHGDEPSSSQVVLQETIYDDETMAFTKVLTSVPQNDKENMFVLPRGGERPNKTVTNLSIDFTEPVPHYIHLNAEHLDNNQEDNMELTLEAQVDESIELCNETKLNEMSMEMTTAIPSTSLIIPDLSMEMTCAVRSMPIVEHHFPNFLQVEQAVPPNSENQCVFQSNPSLSPYSSLCPQTMEITRPITSVLPTNHFPHSTQSFIPNRTILSQNEYMEFSNAIQRNHLQENCEIETLTNENQQKSYESNVDNLPAVSKQHNVSNFQIQQDENTKFFRNSMEFTAIVPYSSQNPNVFQAEPLSSSHDTVFHSKQVESTLPITYVSPTDNSSRKIKPIAAYRTILPQNESMDCTDVIGKSIIIHDKSQDQTNPFTSSKSFQQKSCELSITNTPSTIEKSFDASDTDQLATKRRKLSNPNVNSIKEKNNLENVSIFQNCSRHDLEQVLRRSDGVSFLSCEITESIIQGNKILVEDNMTSNILHISSKELRRNQENLFSDDMGVSQVRAPSLSPCNFVLDDSETKDIQSPNLNEKVEDIVDYVVDVSCSFNNDKKVSSTLPIEKERNHNNFMRNDESLLIEYEEPPSLYFDISNQVEHSTQEVSSIIELNSSKKLLGARRKRSHGERESKVSTNDSKIAEQIAENPKCRRTFVISKQNEIESVSSMQLNDIVKNFLETSNCRRTFVISTKNETRFENMTRLIKDAKNLMGRAKNLLDKSGVTNQKIQSAIESLRRVYMQEKSANHRKTQIINVHSKLLQSSEEYSVQDFIYGTVKETNNGNRITKEVQDPSICKDSFLTLMNNIKSYAKRDDCIWSLRSFDKEVLAVDYISKSLVVLIELNQMDKSTFRDIHDVQIKSLIPDASKDLMKMVHNIIIKKLRPELLLQSHKLFDDILPLLKEISKETKLALNFMFELQRLKNLHLMEVNIKRLSFLTRTKRMTIILKVSLNIKPFDEIDVNDVEVKCLLGSINTSFVKQFIVNVKKDHKFLSRFIDDVKDYIEIIEESEELSKNGKH